MSVARQIEEFLNFYFSMQLASTCIGVTNLVAVVTSREKNCKKRKKTEKAKTWVQKEANFNRSTQRERSFGKRMRAGE